MTDYNKHIDELETLKWACAGQYDAPLGAAIKLMRAAITAEETEWLMRERAQADAAAVERVKQAVQDECMDLFDRFQHWPDVAQAYALVAKRISAAGFGMGRGNK